MEYKSQLYHSFWQGLVKLFVLHQAGQGPIYGGRLEKTLRDRGYDISPGSLYPLLHAMEKANLLSSRLKVFKGRVRKYYGLTPDGASKDPSLRLARGNRGLSLPLRIRNHKLHARAELAVVQVK